MEEGRYPAFRVVHLLGGLRAFDLGGPNVSVGIGGATPAFVFARPPYSHLYEVLTQMGMHPIGVDFISHSKQVAGEIPPEWETKQVEKGFALLDARNEWSYIRQQALDEGFSRLSDIASRIRTYLVLLNIRMRQLSTAYHSTIKSHLIGEPVAKPCSFKNLYMPEIEAAIHSFLSDAASFRDLLAEACWHLILKRSDYDVSTMTGFIKRAKSTTDVTAASILRAGLPGGWIKNLTDLRNDVTHVAPIGDAHEFSMCFLRESHHSTRPNLFLLHFPMTNHDWSLRRKDTDTANFSDEVSIRNLFEAYRAFADNSGDALEYAWRTTSNLVALAEQIRFDAKLSAPIPTMTPIGPIHMTTR